MSSPPRRRAGAAPAGDDASAANTPNSQPAAPRPAAAAPAADDAAAAGGDSPAGDDNPDADDMDRVVEEESEGEDLFDEDNMMDDYKQIDELDQYEADGIAPEDEEAEELAPWQREEAERLMRQRDREKRRKEGRKIGALDTPQSEMDEATPVERQRRRRRIEDGGAVDVDEDGQPISPATAAARAAGRAGAGEEEDDDLQDVVNLDDYSGPLNEWIALDRTRREIKRRFRNFLSEFVAEGTNVPVYPNQMVRMARENRSSLEVSFLDLSNFEPILAVWVADQPAMMFEIFDEEATASTFQLYPEYENIQQDVHVRMTQLPIIDKLRDLRQQHLGVLVRVDGVVTRRTPVLPQLQVVTYNCTKCRAITTPYIQNTQNENRPTRCPECQSNGPFVINSQQTIFRNYQKITLQEAPGSVQAGRVPRHKEVILLHDLIDSCSPGEAVDITGIYNHTYDANLNTKNGFPVFQTVLLANFVSKQTHSMNNFRLTDEDKTQIEALSKKANIGELIRNSIGPSIYGHNDIKTALALAMFSGEPKQFENGHRIRGDINVLVLGDPGTAKSQFLKYTQTTSHRAVYTTGKGASAVGLTASVHRDPLTGEWTLEGGALVQADQGVCLIDEFDKMNDQDRTSIHEAMEQQSISISKAGIITTLKARCSVIAAANPVMGRYDSSKTFAENVELTDAILSRFDILCVVRDTVDPNVDERLASFVIDSHMKARENNNYEHNGGSNNAAGSEESKQPDFDSAEARTRADPAYGRTDMIPQEILRKYIHYARTYCHPRLNKIDDDKISKLYADLRRESMVTGGIPIAVRHIESIIRMSEAHAKMHLRTSVIDEDVDLAIQVMLESFISSQKFAVMRPLRQHFEKYLTAKKDQNELLLFTLQTMVNEEIQTRMLQGPDISQLAAMATPIRIPYDSFKQKAAQLSIDKSTYEPFLSSPLCRQNNFSLDQAKKFIIKTFPRVQTQQEDDDM